jgi:putative hemolysin
VTSAEGTLDPAQDPVPAAGNPFDKRELSYAGTFRDPRRAAAIRTIEWLTGKVTLLGKIRRFEREGAPQGHAFWSRALQIMGIRIDTPDQMVRRIPGEGPLVVVANHPHGLVDGMVLAELIGRVRGDYRILTRSLLTGVPEVSRFLMPVPFPHEEDALKRNLEMRRAALAHLADGGVVALFPSGSVAASRTMFGPAIEAEWNPFTAKLILRSGATVLPVFFPGANSRAYQIANRISPTLRQGLLIHEVVHAMDRPQSPIIGAPILPEALARRAGNATAFMAWLRAHTLALASQRVGTGVSPE